MPHPPQNWDAIKEIVAEALDLPQKERDVFLADRCAQDGVLRDEVVSLIAASDESDGVMAPRIDAWLGLGGPDLLALGGQRIGRYILEKLVSEGAMAAVYLARQVKPERRVAIKLLRAPLPLIDSAGRFDRESDALGRLQHPNIARIYEAGIHRSETGAPMPFIAMEYVDGSPLTHFAREKKLDRDQLVKLMIKVSSAVHAAHQQAIIHRDLKPANVLVDASGEPKVLDFGIARIAGTEANNHTWQTTAGMLLGTPGYMSPEQAGGKLNEVDVRSDVWALGVLLYELLTGKLPIDVTNTSITEVLRRIESTEPVPMSRVDPSLHGDLDVVVMTALSREKILRYPSAQAMADDLQRVLDYEPIQARPPSKLYRASKFIRRHRVGIVLSTILAVTLAGATVVSFVYSVRATRQRDRATAINAFLQQMISAPDPSTGNREVSMLSAINAAESRIAKTFASDPRTEADVRSTVGWTYYNLGQYDRASTQLTRAVELRNGIGDTASPEMFEDQSRLVTILRWQYRPKEALGIATRAYESAVKTFGPRSMSAINLLDPLAGSYQDLGNFAEAERIYVEALRTSSEVVGDDREPTLTLLNNLAVVYNSQSKFAQAEPLLQQLLLHHESTGGASLLPALSVRLNLAINIAEQGRLTEAEAALQALSIDAVKALGSTHDTTFDILSTHAEMLQRLGQIDAAVALVKKVLDDRVAANGWSNEPTLIECADYAGLLNQCERWDEALAVAQRGVAEAIKIRPAHHLLVNRNRAQVAGALSGLKRFDEGLPIYEQVLGDYQRDIGDTHPRTLVFKTNYGNALIDAGRADDAVALLEPTLQFAMKQKMTNVAAVAHRNLGKAFLAQQRYDLAERELLQAFDDSKQQGAKRNMSRTAELLVKLYEATNKPDQAKQWRESLR